MQIEALRQTFSYSEGSPSGLIWKVPAYRGNARNRYIYRYVGDVAGSLNPNGYWYLGLRRKDCKISELCHRVVYALWHGKIDDDITIDHIDGNPMNNRIDNLRAASYRENKRNSKMYSNNSSGATGVAYEEGRGGKSGYGRYKARWVDLHGKCRTRSFAVSKYGHEEAKRLAEQARQEGTAASGDYTSRHGT